MHDYNGVSERFLLIENNKNTKSIVGKIIFASGKRVLTSKEKFIIINLFKSGSINNFTGDVTILNVGYLYEESATFEEGKMAKHSILTSNSTNAANEHTASIKGCINWYLITSYNGQVISEDYLFTSCDCESAQSARIASNKTIYDACTNGGGGGGGGGNGGGAPPGHRPYAKHTDPCAFALDMWNRSISTTSTKEWCGVVTFDNKFIITQELLSASGGPIHGITTDLSTGQVVYYYPLENVDEDLPTYPGSRLINYNGVRCFMIPVKGVVHTHQLCLNSGGTGLENSHLSDDDKNACTKFPNVTMWAIGCGGVVSEFNSSGFLTPQGVPCNQLAR